MTAAVSRLAFNDCFDIFDQAIADPTGIRVAFSSEGAAIHFRMRLHRARTIDRQDNAKLHPSDHPMHGRSPYDQIIIKIRKVEEGWFVYLEALLDAGRLRVESLEGLEVPPPPPKPQVDMIMPEAPDPVIAFESLKQITFRRR